MTEYEILKIKEHIEIHARREPQAVKIIEILWKAVDELEHVNYWKTRCRDLAGRLRLFIGKDEQLTKAKGLIKRLMHELVVSNRPYEEVELLVKDVEQFLNEVK